MDVRDADGGGLDGRRACPLENGGVVCSSCTRVGVLVRRSSVQAVAVAEQRSFFGLLAPRSVVRNV